MIFIMPGFRFTIFLVLLSLFLILTFGVLIGMRTDKMGQMSDCLFGNGEVFCRMGVFEHLVRFQQAFAGLPVRVILLLAVFLIWSLSGAKTKVFTQDSEIFYVKSTQDPNFVFDIFLLALSDGIVQPKLYA